jgi:hypothetical protein
MGVGENVMRRDSMVGRGRARVFLLSLYTGFPGPLTGHTLFCRPCRAAQRVGVAAQARARCTGRASPSTVMNGPCRAWTGPKSRAFGRAAVLGPFGHL